MRRTAHSFRVHRQLGRALAVQRRDERVAVQHLYVNFACTENRLVGFEFFCHGIACRQVLTLFVAAQQAGQL